MQKVKLTWKHSARIPRAICEWHKGNRFHFHDTPLHTFLQDLRAT